MAKKHVRIDDKYYETLHKLSQESEVSIARLVNRAIGHWLALAFYTEGKKSEDESPKD